MSQLLKPKQTVIAESSGLKCEVLQFLGGGGQGEVYKADLGGHAVALKWYFQYSATPQQKQSLDTLVKKGPPNDRFLWPMELVSAKGLPGFGYVMPLRSPGFKSIVDLMKRRVDTSFRALATTGLELSESFFQLHAKGLCYGDINFGNVFFDPKTGQVLICDNDNVAVDGEAYSGVPGTPRFMAPEIVRGEAKPSRQTDLFSLSVLLFYLFMIHHPLEGKRESSIKCFDLPAMNKLYGYEPLFIFDPKDTSNAPVAGFHDNAIQLWPVYPQFLRDIFTRSFTRGLRDHANGRVQENEWRSALVALRDSIVYCQKCGSENFCDVDALKKSKGQPPSCWHCRSEIILPPRIRIAKSVIMLNHDTKLYPHHIDDGRRYDFQQPVAEVTQHPSNPNVWGLKNLTTEKWAFTSGDGTIKDVDPQRNAPVAVGAKINFGKSEGEIRI